MQSTPARVAVGIVAIAIVVIGFIALSGGDDSDDSTTQTTATTATTDDTAPEKDGDGKSGGGDKAESTPEIPVIEVAGGEPVGGVKELSFNAGDTIEFEVSSDTAAEVHFHGYDVGQDVEAGGTTEFSVPADIEGIFEVELEETAVPIAEITVNP